MVLAARALGGRPNLIRMVLAVALITSSVGALAVAPARAIVGSDAGVAASVSDDGSGGVTISYEITNNNATGEGMAVNSLVMLYGNEVIDLAAVGCSTNFPVVSPGQTAAGCTFSLPADSPDGYTGPEDCGSNLIFGGSVVGDNPEDGASKTVEDVTVQCGGPVVTPGEVPEGSATTTTTTTSSSGGTAAAANTTAEGVTVDKSADQTTVTSGTSVDFTISVTNNSGGDVAIIRLRDDLVAPTFGELDLLDSGSNDFEACTDLDSGQVVDIASFPIVADGTTFACSFSMDITGANGTVWTDQADVTIDFLGQDKENVTLLSEAVDVTVGTPATTTTTTEATTTTTTEAPTTSTTLPDEGLPREDADWEITKTAAVETTLTDEIVTYTVVVENHTGDAGDITSLIEVIGGVSDDLLDDDPADGLDSVCADENGVELSGTQTVPSTGELVCVFAIVATGAEGDVITDTVTATIHAAGADPAVDDPITTIADDAEVTIVAEAGPLGLSVVKTDNDATVQEPGDLVVYSLAIANLSPVEVTITSMTDSVSGNPGFSIDGLGGSNCTTGRVLQPAGQLGDSFDCEFTIFVAGPTGADVTDVVSVTAEDSTGRTITVDDNEATPVEDALPAATIAITDDDASGAAPLSDVTFDVTITNTGREVLTIDSLLATIGSETGVDVTTVGDIVTATTFESGTLIPAFSNTVYTFSYTAKVSGTVGDEVATELTLQGSDDEDNLLTVAATETTPMTGSSADISLTKSATGSVDRGEEIDYLITVSNAGPDTATGVTVTDVLPDETTFVRAQGTNWTCDVSGSTLTCEGPPLDLGETSELTVTVRINQGFSSDTVTNSAEVNSDQGDITGANNVGSASNAVTGAVVGGTSTTIVVGGQLPISGANSRTGLAQGGLLAGIGLALWSLTSVYRQHDLGMVTSLPVDGPGRTPIAQPGSSVRLAARVGSLLGRISRPVRRRN